MWVYIVRRLLWLPVLLFAISFVIFWLFRVAPGDPVIVMLGNRARPEVKERLRNQLGLDRPFLVQYGDYMWHVVKPKFYRPGIGDATVPIPFMSLDFGESFRYRGQPVRDVILPKMWVSAQLTMAALLISVAFGLPLGFFVAHKQGSWIDPTTVATSLVFMAILPMLSVPALLWLMCLKLHWVPCSGWGGLFDARIIVPAISMGTPGIAAFIRLMRASTLDVMNQDFIRTAHAKGLSTLRIDTRHIFRNAIIPIVTILAFALAGLIGGAIVTERIMGIPGIGFFAVQSVFDRDFPVLMAITLITAVFFVMATLLADVAYTLIDPRIRYQ